MFWFQTARPGTLFHKEEFMIFDLVSFSPGSPVGTRLSLAGKTLERAGPEG